MKGKKYKEVEAMSIARKRELTLPEIALIAGTRGAIGFGAGLLLADKFRTKWRKAIGWSLFLIGVASTVPIAVRVFGEK
ncbi:MAG: hypothetical protein ACJ754_11520 [Pyrinomonadaceae bacterium]